MNELYDCIVIGAGPAGLSASLFLARYRHRALTFHHNSPRNLYSHGVHGFLGLHGIPPAELLERGREEVIRHGGNLREERVDTVELMGEDCFAVRTGDGKNAAQTFSARKVILATGLRDLTPDCPGFRDFYGRSVHHCPECDGFEHTGQRIAVLGRGKQAVNFALGLLAWTDRLTILTDGEPGDWDAEHKARLAQLGVATISERVSGLEGDVEAGQLHRVLFADRAAFECDALFFSLGTQPACDLHVQLGCKLDDECGLVWVDEHQRTSVPGVYAAGDLTPRSQLAIVAAAEGAMAAIHIHKAIHKALLP